MSAVEIPVTTDNVVIPRKVWTRAEVNRLFSDSPLLEPLELVNGDLIDRRMGKNPPHKFWLSVLRGWFIQQFGVDYVRSEESIDVALNDNPVNEPEPDLTVTTDSLRVTRATNPGPSSLRLVVEVSDSTYGFDTRIKAELYARAEIREYWVLDVRTPDAPRLLVFRDPRDGMYCSKMIYAHTQSIDVLGEKSLCLLELM